jgi:hypothetical protein
MSIKLLIGVIVPIGRLNKFPPSSKIYPPQTEKEVIMKKAFMMLILTLFLFATVGNVFGEEMEKEGTVSSTAVTSGTYTVIPVEEGSFVMTFQEKGVMLDDSGEGPYHNASEFCVGVSLFIKGIGSHKGYCVNTAPNGDKWVGEFFMENIKPGPAPKKGTYKIVGGSGKLEGIEGGGEYINYNVQPAAQGTYQSVSKIKGNYKLP